METIVIFGGAGAIAHATAKIWAQENPSFILLDRNEDQLKVIADDLQARGASAVHTITSDLADTATHQELWQRIKEMGRPSIVLIAHGVLGNQKESEKDFSRTQKELTINLLSPISLLTIIANDIEANTLPELKTVAVITSVAGDRGRASNAIYGTAKGALTIFVSGLRGRLMKKKITLITIKPGFTDTPMTASFKKGILWSQPEVVAQGIVKAIKKKRAIVYLPGFWRLIMWIVKTLPESIFQKLPI